MLPLSRISQIEPYSKEWFRNRLGKMTSSQIACLCAPKGIGEGGMTYIRNKVSEVITGVSTERNVTNEAILFGIENEPKAIQYWRSVTPAVHRMITDTHIVFNERFSSTPDALVMMNEKLVFTEDGDFLNCETLETKSYMTPSVHMAHVECKTPQDLKLLDPKIYWQKISQIEWAGVTRGRTIFFHPHFPESSPYRLGEVIFKKTELLSEFQFFNTRMQEAIQIFEKVLNFKK
jgi:hypothetical protein